MKQHAITGRSGYRRAWLALAAISSSRAAAPFSPSAAWRTLPGVSGGGAGQVAGPGLGLAFAGPGQLGVAPGSVPASSSRVRA
jgi:hypothetical protein